MVAIPLPLVVQRYHEQIGGFEVLEHGLGVGERARARFSEGAN
jgi:hypothetical protein